MTSDPLWGPYPRMAAALAAAGGGAPLPSRYWPLKVPGPQAFWPTVAPGLGLWPAGLQPLPAAAPSAPPWLHRQWWRFRSGIQPPAVPAAPAAVEGLRECAGWLQERVLRNFVDWVDPLWDQVPMELLRVGPRGVFWVLTVFALDRWGPTAAASVMERQNARTGGLDGIRASAGDALAFHLVLEDCLARRMGPLQITPPRGTGGFRVSAESIARYQALRGRIRRGTWEQAFDRLARISPLTRLTYIDVIPLNAEPVVPADFSALLPEAYGEWADLYLGQLARTIVAALFSPPAAFEERQTAQRNLDGALAVARQTVRAVPNAKNTPAEPRAVRDARQQLEEANRLLRGSYVDRLVVLAAILTQLPLLRLRFLDMFVRQIVAAKAKEIDTEWRKKYNNIPRPKASDVCEVKADGVCFQTFRDLLLGTENRAGSEPAVRGEADRLIPALRVLRPLAPPEKAAAHSWMETIERRFFSGSVELPFRRQDGNDRAGPPGQLLTSWVESLINSIAVADEVTQGETQEDDDGQN